MTPTQIDLARHALGFQGKQKVSHRNYFVTGPGSDDYENWRLLVDEGDARRTDGKNLPFGGDDIFRLTLQGARKALRKGEKLSPKDFPEACAA